MTTKKVKLSVAQRQTLEAVCNSGKHGLVIVDYYPPGVKLVQLGLIEKKHSRGLFHSTYYLPTEAGKALYEEMKGA